EVNTLRRHVDRLATDRGGGVLVSGEPGIGKSTLARALADLARERDIPVVWGFAWEAGGAPAYWPWTQLFRSLIALRTIPAAPALARILPEWATPAAAEVALQPDQARFQLLEAVRGFLAAAAQQGPFVVILEDLHAADTDSLHLLSYLAKHVQHMPMLIAGTFREMEARTTPGASPLWQAARDAEVLHPPRLTDRDIREYLKRRTGSAPDTAQVAGLLTVTEGNPLFLTELVGLMAQQPTATRLPDTVQQVIRRQIDRLPRSDAELLAPAAILGRTFDLDELAYLTDRPRQAVERALQGALDAGLLEHIYDGHIRFFHVLCRDVLAQDMETRQREALHLRHAGLLRNRTEADLQDRYTELATHLSEAGTAHCHEAVEAWRAAARRATERLAFDEAAHALERALECFGDGPRFAPLERLRLMLDLASAELARGDIESGQQICREAYALARTVKDPRLMAEAVLTYGSAIVVARVDPDLIAALKETLALLPASDTATRARVSARLAGALQPAPKPAEPVQMARDAIALARTTEDDAVIYEVLRSAVSAMMDFAPAPERVALNREFGELAARFGDVPGQFRTTLRLIIDAAELGDRQMLSDSIAACEQIAARIELPHYQWRVASVRALQATIEGAYEDAQRLLEEAASLAASIGETSALLTIPLQRLTILQDWAAPTALDLERISADLDTALKAFPEAEFYARPLFASFKEPEAATVLLDNEAVVDRILAGGDRYTMCRLVESAVKAGRTGIVQRAFDALLPFRDQCATMGLMGTSWQGPVAEMLGVAGISLGRQEEARIFLTEALDICRRMHAGPTAARVQQHLAALARDQGDAAEAETWQGQADVLLLR
ncbi:MAG: AAA family ATPase, partial [Gammaproteobacteria bacterium]